MEVSSEGLKEKHYQNGEAVAMYTSDGPGDYYLWRVTREKHLQTSGFRDMLEAILGRCVSHQLADSYSHRRDFAEPVFSEPIMATGQAGF